MERLNDQHLHYFWTVAKTGPIKAACETLGVAQPTISGQLAIFQKTIGARVFKKEGRKLALTECGLLKSAQLPMHGWLIEVMETPTPVSALLHAGLINAGGFLVFQLRCCTSSRILSTRPKRSPACVGRNAASATRRQLITALESKLGRVPFADVRRRLSGKRWARAATRHQFKL